MILAAALNDLRISQGGEEEHPSQKVSQLGRVVYPRLLNGAQSRRGPAALPNHELPFLNHSLRVCAAVAII